MKKVITLVFLINILISCKDKKREDLIKIHEKEAVVKSEKTTAITKVVTAKSGLNFRQKPKGKVLGKFKKGTKLSIVKKTGITEEILDAGNKTTGEWVGVKHNNTTVYVFDAFLSEPKKAEIPETKNPIDIAILQAYIIKPGEYHGDEIPNGITSFNWWGIFKENENYTVKETDITITEVQDAVLDDNNQKSGKKITANKNGCYLLMNNISYLKERNIDTIRTKPLVIHPEKPYNFQFNNNQYTLSATAKEYDQLNLNTTYFNAEGYKLFLEKIENGNKTKQLLLFEKYFDDQMIEILFIGDIDGDGIPDILLNSSNHYNLSRPTLYLSKEANSDKILKIVSLHKSVGC